MKVLTTILAAVCPFISYGQKLSGKVVDGETAAPLTYASVSLKGGSDGTVTNTDGVFDFYFSLRSVEDTLMISMLGYSPFETRLKDVLETGNRVFPLKAKPIQLTEVNIVGTRLSAREIVEKAFESVEKNFPDKPYVFHCFYRETHEENEKSVIVTEAALDIYDKGYQSIRGNRSWVREKVNLKNVRTSKNYRHSLLKNSVVDRYNLVITALRDNPVKYRDPHASKLLRNKTLTLEGVIYSNDVQVYVISFLTYLKQYPNFERKNTLYIAANNYAIYKYGWEEYAKEGKYSETPWALTEGSNFLSWRKRISTTYEYENRNGRMFLKYFDERCWEDIYNASGDSVEFEQLGHNSLVVTEIETEKVQPESKNLMEAQKSLYTQATSYNPGFWKDLRQVVPLTKKQVNDLEWEMPLEEQFKLENKPK